MEENREIEQNIRENADLPKSEQTNTAYIAKNDDFVIGESFTIGGDSKKKKAKSPRWVKTLIISIIVLVISSTLAIGGLMVMSDYFGLGEDTNCELQIEQGTSGKEIADKLEECGAVKYGFVFRVYSKLMGYENDYKYGVYMFNRSIGYEGIAEMLTNEGAKASSVKVTIPEMATIDDIAVLFEENGISSKKEFYNVVENSDLGLDFVEDIPEEKVYYRLEGYLYPETYYFFNTNSADGAMMAVRRMLNTLDEQYTEQFENRAEEMGYTMHEVLTMASIIELETSGIPDEMANVSAVFYNRLNNWGDEPKFLGSSPTAEYKHGGGKYDTNKNQGLPPGPLCSPSLNSIKAALYPNEEFVGKYYYFVTDADSKFYYNETLTQHQSTINSLVSQGKWLG